MYCQVVAAAAAVDYVDILLDLDKEHGGQVEHERQRAQHEHEESRLTPAALERVHNVRHKNESLHADADLNQGREHEHRLAHEAVRIGLKELANERLFAVWSMMIERWCCVNDQDEEHGDERVEQVSGALAQHVLVDGHLSAQLEQSQHAQQVAHDGREAHERRGHARVRVGEEKHLAMLDVHNWFDHFVNYLD